MKQENDFILKMTEVIGRAIAKIIGLKERGQYTQALEEVFYNQSLFFGDLHIEEEGNYKKLDTYGTLLLHEIEIYLKMNELEKVKSLIDRSLKSLKKARDISKSYDILREQKINKLETILISEPVGFKI